MAVREVVRSVLTEYDIWSESAEDLLITTATIESDCGRIVRQGRARRPALGFFQIERSTYEYLKRRYGDEYGFTDRNFEELEQDQRLGTLLAFLKYDSVGHRFGSAKNPKERCKVWKKKFNTRLGKGTIRKCLKCVSTMRISSPISYVKTIAERATD